MVFCMLSLDYQHLLLEENLSFLGRTLVWRNPQADRRCPSGLEEGLERSHNLCTKWCSRRSSGVLTRCFAGWFCPGSKLIPVRAQFNCAPIQLSLGSISCPQQNSDPRLSPAHAGTLPLCSKSWAGSHFILEQVQKKFHPPAMNSCVCFMSL